MPGTAAGAAKASAAAAAARARRRAEQEQAKQSANGFGTVSKQSGGGAVVPSLAVGGGPLEPLPGASPSALHSQVITPLLPKAAEYVGRVIDGKTKASPAVRANTALEVLRQGQKPSGGGAGVPAAAAAALAALGKALAASAAPVERVVGGDVVAEQ